MKYRKIIYFLDNTPNQPVNFQTKSWVEINDDAGGIYNTNSQIKFKTSMLKSSLCDCRDAYIFVSGTKEFLNTGTGAVPNNRKKYTN